MVENKEFMMNLMLPWTDDAVKANLVDKTLVLSKSEHYSSMYASPIEIVLAENGDVAGVGRWETSSGVLRFVDVGGALLYEFPALEVKNGVVCMSGRNVREISPSGLNRSMLHEKISLASVKYGVCVSSHTDYEETTLPKLLGSLKNSGFDMSGVLVVIAGDTKAILKTTVEDQMGARIVRIKKNSMGFRKSVV